MSVTTGEVLEPQRVHARRWDRVRHALLVGWLLVLLATPFVGERNATWGDLRAQVAAGEVDAVHVAGELRHLVNGYSVVEISWSHGWQRYRSEVVQARGRGQRRDAAVAADGDAPVVRAVPSDVLTALQPDLQVTPDRRRAHGSLLLWQVPQGVALTAVGLALAGFGLLVAGPQPWRATRWAWFWLLIPPVGSIAFLVLSGPTPGLPRPRDEQRRLKGGWAFLMAIPPGAVLAPYVW